MPKLLWLEGNIDALEERGSMAVLPLGFLLIRWNE